MEARDASSLVGSPFRIDAFRLWAGALPSGRTELVDGDELEEASAAGVVTLAQRASAWEEAERVRAAIRSGTFEPVTRSVEFLELAREHDEGDAGGPSREPARSNGP